ncbi:MAG: NTP transferase domain-containing protein [Bellilinea sp.]
MPQSSGLEREDAMSAPVSVVILAAGSGKRMRSSLPKVLHPLGGIPLIEHSLRAAAQVSHQPPVLVVGHGAEQVRAAVGTRARYALQAEQLGTAHALRTAQLLLAGAGGRVLVITGDMPLLRGETFRRLIDLQSRNEGPFSMLTVTLDDPHGFGRVVRADDGAVRAIVEEALAPPEVLAIRELNASVYCFESDWLWGALPRVPLSPKGEYYLTDLAGIAAQDGLPVQALSAGDAGEALGINTRQHLAEAEAVLRRRTNQRWMEAGVTLIDPLATTIEVDVEIGADTLLYPGCYLAGQTCIGANCRIGPQAVIRDSRIGDGCRVAAAWLENCRVEDGGEVPACRYLRGETVPAARQGE